ncbi:D-cysteine desulfhydrase family protein [Trinickia sp.]|uniref:D-cysteine desulfhydrase family protein n=1 Tax=Trinickia sp. TaxID=2571163 RepID=UPI003F807E58
MFVHTRKFLGLTGMELDNASRLRQHLEKFDRCSLGHFPTPLEAARRLMPSAAAPSIYVKRDDASGLGGGGNKVRALEYLIPSVLSSGADTIVTAGVVQSNSVRQVAAAAAKIGLACHFGMITDRVPVVDNDYAETGNIFLDRLYGATCEPMSVRDDKPRFLQAMADRLSREGRRPYVVPYGCANALGATGYLRCALEIAEQAASAGIALTHVVHASGTGGTQAGLIVGFALLGLDIDVVGIDIDADPIGVRARVTGLLEQLCADVGLDADRLRERIIVEDRYSAGHYGMADSRTVDAICLAAQREALLLDPVYSGKAFAALLDFAAQGRFSSADRVLFLHTGGTPAIYAYRSHFDRGALERDRETPCRGMREGQRYRRMS